ncbi:unnamed protein product, partial [Rangifer tarandus platyrhynchus]
WSLMALVPPLGCGSSPTPLPPPCPLPTPLPTRPKSQVSTEWPLRPLSPWLTHGTPS